MFQDSEVCGRGNNALVLVFIFISSDRPAVKRFVRLLSEAGLRNHLKEQYVILEPSAVAWKMFCPLPSPEPTLNPEIDQRPINSSRSVWRK